MYMRISLGGYTSDGDRLDLQTLTLQLFELICVGLSSSGSLSKTLLGKTYVYMHIRSIYAYMLEVYLNGFYFGILG